MRKRFGIGINDNRIPSGLMGKTEFATKFEESIRSPILERMFRRIDKILQSERRLNFFYYNRSTFPFRALKHLFDILLAKVEKSLFPNRKEAILAFHGQKGGKEYRSVLGGHLLHIFNKYLDDWHTKQESKIPIPAHVRKIKPPPKTYSGWKSIRDEIQPNWIPVPTNGEPVKILPTDTMTPRERIYSLVQGKYTDRVGFGPMWDFASSYIGGSNIWEFCYDGIANGLSSVNTWLRVGGSDWRPLNFGYGAYAVPFPEIHSRYYYKWNLPHDANFPQFLEQKLIKSYQDIFDYGFNATLQEIPKRLMRDTIMMLRELLYQGKVLDRYLGPIKDQFYPYSTGFISAFDLIPMSRGLIDFSIDVKKRPDQVEQIFEFITKPLTDLWINLSKGMKADTCMIGCSRGSTTFMSLQDFQATHWKSLKYSINEILKAGMTCTLHLDNNWMGVLQFFVDNLPKRSCILHLDQLDLAEAHKITGDHFCLMGAISPALAVNGTPVQLEAKLKSYIDEIGSDGLILASGCEIPVDIPIQNLMTYKKTIAKYGVF